MRPPPELPTVIEADDVRMSRYVATDAAPPFAALRDPVVREHIPHPIPTTSDELHRHLTGKLAGSDRVTFTIRVGGEVVGMTSVLVDGGEPDGVEIGGTQLARAVWGTGVNLAVKQLLLAALFDAGASWVQLRTDERNARSAAAIRKLGAVELGVRQDSRVRRDGSLRRSAFFRITSPEREAPREGEDPGP